VNGDRVEFDEQTRLDFSGVFIEKRNQTRIGIYFTSGISVNTRAIEEFLTYQISIPARFKGLTLITIAFFTRRYIFLDSPIRIIVNGALTRNAHQHDGSQIWKLMKI
jgi:hypothetical protein